MTRVNMFDGGIEAGEPVKVLVVEDEALIGAMVSDALLDRGFDVQVVASADDAMRFLNSGLRIDVLFTDINIAGNVDGTELAQQARDVRPDLPIVFASGRLHLLDDLRGTPRTACLPKPYSPAQVCATVEGLFATLH